MILNIIVAILNYNLYIILIDKNMKPLNLDNLPCSPISSNCVIWQGPDLACIKLCKGDTVSDVVAKMATELCAILEQLNVDNYDLTCFNSTACGPVDFQAMIQFLINHICQLENINTGASGFNGNNSNGTSNCPDCVVTVASCFIQNNQTTMQLVDYVNMIAERICSILTNITNLQNQITNLNSRVTILENQTSPTFTLPSILVDCVLQDTPFIGNGGGATPIDAVLSALINDDIYGYCALTTATGLPANITTAVDFQTITSTTNSLVYGTPMSTAYNSTWVSNPQNVADSITNLWVSLLDVYDYLNTTFTNTVVESGENITVTSATVGSTTTYTVNSDNLNYFSAELIINASYQPINGSIPVIVANTVNGLENGQIINQYNSIVSNNILVQATATPGSFVANASVPVCSFGTFDNATSGEFTITKRGTYLIQASCNLKSISDSSLFWQSGDLAGSFGIGLLTSGNTVLNGQYNNPVPNLNKHVNVTVDSLLYLQTGTVIKLSLLNLTNREYNGNTFNLSDNIKFSITQIK